MSEPEASATPAVQGLTEREKFAAWKAEMGPRCRSGRFSPSPLEAWEEARAALSAPEQAAQQADARDAARYRWLRDNDHHQEWPPKQFPTPPWCVRCEIDHGMPTNKFVGGPALDAAIDAAMAASKKEG